MIVVTSNFQLQYRIVIISVVVKFHRRRRNLNDKHYSTIMFDNLSVVY